MKQLLLILLFLTTIHGFSQDSSHYTIFYSGRNAGFIHIKRTDKTNTIHFRYNDRGRGPDQYFSIVTSKENGIESFIQKGVGYMKDTVSTNIYLKGAQYYSISGKDTTASTFQKLNLYNFASDAGLYEFFYPILTDSINYGNHPFFFEKILEKTFQLKGKPVKATLYNYHPKNNMAMRLVWLDEKNRLLAEINPWNDVIAQGKEGLRAVLRHMNDSILNLGLAKQSEALFKKAFSKIAFYNTNYVDVEKGELITNKTILISNGIIEKIGDTGSIKIPADYKKINAGNKFLMPGLWDMHAHVFPGEGISYLANGVTAIRDLGNNLQLPIVKQLNAKGILAGPRIAWMCGFIDFNDDMAGPCGIFINNVAEGIAAVKKYKQLGYRSIKLYSSIKPAYVKPIAAAAHQLGMLVHGHVPAHMTATEAITDGYDEVNHLNMLVLGYFGKEIDTRTRIRLTLMKERAYEASPFSNYAKELIALMRQKNIILDPTSILYGPYISKLKMSYKDSIEKKCVDTLFSWLKVLYQNKIRFVAGTDAAGGSGIVNELKNYASIGMPNADVLRTATIWSAQYAGLAKETGSIAEGKAADLIILGDNPLKKLSTLDDIQAVISNGRMFYMKDLRAAHSGAKGMSVAMQHAH